MDSKALAPNEKGSKRIGGVEVFISSDESPPCLHTHIHIRMGMHTQENIHHINTK